MRLIAILIALLLRRFWSAPSLYEESSLLLDRSPLLKMAVSWVFKKKDFNLSYLVFIAVTLSVIFVLYRLSGGWFLSALWSLFEIGLLFLILGDTRTENDLDEYLPLWRNRDPAGVKRHLCTRFHHAFPPHENQELFGLNNIYWDAWIQRWMQRIFMPLFWYVLLGPLALVWLMSNQLILTEANAQLQSGENDPEQCDGNTKFKLQELVGFLLRMELWLIWLPTRLVAITFLLTGNFFKAVDDVAKGLFEWRLPDAELLSQCAKEALGSTPVVEGDEARLWQEERRLQSLRRLLNRTLFVWLAAIAILVVFFS